MFASFLVRNHRNTIEVIDGIVVDDRRHRPHRVRLHRHLVRLLHLLPRRRHRTRRKLHRKLPMKINEKKILNHQSTRVCTFEIR